MGNPGYFLPTLPEALEGLVELGLDLRWSWSYSADALWRRLDPELWELTRNPWLILQTVGETKLVALSRDESFREALQSQVRARREALEQPGWFQKSHPRSRLTVAAYFSMEFGLSEALPIYSGGLGILAGDHLKTASDLGVPVVGVGLLYQQGYFRQVLDAQGEQTEVYSYNDPSQLPVTPVRAQDGEWLHVSVALPGRRLWLRAWAAQVGRVKLYLLDSNDPINAPADQGITAELYGGGPEVRLQQEIALGIAGFRLIRALGIRAEVCHLNEGHAALAVLERARAFMDDSNQSFEIALTVTRAGNLFTTHTPVAAGFDRFDPGLIKRYLGAYADGLGIGVNGLLALGREHPDDSNEPFNMAFLAIRGSGAVNGVSRLHGEVSRHLFSRLFPRWPIAEVPVGHVTNGVHVPSWDSAEADKIWANACGEERWLGDMTTIEQDLRSVPDEILWALRTHSRQELIRYARRRLERQLAAAGSPESRGTHAQHIFNPNALTLGFARRFAAYKRPNLLLHDPERLARLLTDPQRPVQLIIAGKAHPQDLAGKALVQAWIRFVRLPEVRRHAIFLSDYDMLLAERLVQGVDVWINTPRRPWEACGTSGMKVLVNGGLNLSELDGWWAEAYAPDAGWALGDGQEHGDDPAWDAAEAEGLYALLEREIIPEFYRRDENDIPRAWVARMRESMACLTPLFSANRTVREYTEKYYLPSAAAYGKRAADKGAVGRQVVDWHDGLQRKWAMLHFGEMKVETVGEQHVFEVQVYFNDVDPSAVRLELYAEGVNGGNPVRQELACDRRLVGAVSGYVYGARVPATRPATDFTARMIPSCADVAVPLEASRILWQR